ncbi:MAG: efflux RND transporter permease subunit [Salinivirgaceae bacterium]
MLNSIIKYALHNRLLVLVSSVLLMAVGIYTTTRMEVDVFPDLTAPTVVIMTEAEGMAPEEVEKLVSFPIETAVNGATGIRRVRSSSAMGFSIVWAEFDWNMDVYNARQIVSEKLITIKEQLPEGAGNPVLAPQSSLMGEITVVALTADSTSMMDLRSLADWQVRTRLLATGGIAQVAVFGGDLKQYQILVDPLKMHFYQVSLSELMEAANNSNVNVPGGFIDQYHNSYIIRGMGRTSQLSELGNTLIKFTKNSPVRLRDVATVTIGPAPKIGSGSYKGENSVILTITKQPSVNTLELSERIDETLDAIQKTLPADVAIHTDIFNQADFIERSVNNVSRALFEGGFFVVIILFLFLMNYRTTLISLLAIPLSLLVAIIILKLLGFTINTMSLGGMAIAIGSLVDDAIIDVENVYKRLRENVQLKKSHRKPVLKVVYDASVEIRASILNATLIIMVAFIPLFFLSGMEGRMLKPLGITYIVSLFASLIVAITVTPVLSSLLLTNKKRLKRHSNGSWLEVRLKKYYQFLLQRVMLHPKSALLIAGVLLLFSVGLLTRQGRSFLPDFNEGTLTISLSAMPGVSLDESNKLGQKAERLLLSIPEISVVERRTGRAELSEHSFGSNVSEIDAPYKISSRSEAEFLNDVRQKLSSIQGIAYEVGQPISHRINHMLSGSKASIAIKLYGDHLGEMYQYANQIKAAIQDVPGIVDLNVEQQVSIPQIQIKPRRELLARYGITLSEFLEFTHVAFNGQKVSDVFEGQESYDLVVRLSDEYRNDLNRINDALITTQSGQKIPLRFVADVVSTKGPNTINRENVQRLLIISANVAETDIRHAVNAIKSEIETKVTLPEGYSLKYGGQFESEAEASRILVVASLLALLVIYLLLYQEFKNLKLAGIIMLNLPLALIGGILAIQFSSGELNIPALIGFITLFGIATRNGILLVSRYQTLHEQGMALGNRVIIGSVDRLIPILMTALTAALALIPLALKGDLPGNEIQSPMAIVILGGLLSSTLLNGFIIPVVYLLMNKKEA